MRLAIDPDGIVNLGAEQPQDAASVAVVDLGKSPDLLNTLSGELRLDTTNNYVIPVLTSRYAQQRGRSTYITRDTLMVTVAAKNHSRVTLYALEDGRWTKVSDLTPADVPDKNPVSLRDKFKLKPGTEPMQYQGLERIAIAAAQSSADASSFSQASGQQWRDLAAQNGLENPLSPVNTGSGLTNSPLGTGKPKPKPAGDKPPPEDIPQVQSYMAYGQSPWCNRQCSAGSCQGCCIAAHAVEEAHVFGASLACHIASDLCPWCHVGCAAMTGVMVATMTTMDTACMKTCQVGNRLPATNNPQRCPVQ
jgi:hypothetical protein